MKSWFARFARLRRMLLVVAAVLLLVAMALPIWQITLDAPQYPPPEGPLEVKLYLYPQLGGDYEEVNRLNAYVGFYYPDPVLTAPDFPIHENSVETPEWVFAPWIFLVLAGLTLFVAVAPNTRKLRLGLISLFLGTSIVFVGALVAVQARLYQAGHNLDPGAPMAVEGFTPPVLGSYEVANISGFAWLGSGAWLTVAAVVCMFVAVLMRNSDATLVDLVRSIGDRFAGLRDVGDSTGSEMVFSVSAVAMLAVVIGLPVAPVGPGGGVSSGDAFRVEPRQVAPSVDDESMASIDSRQYTTAQEAIDDASPGDTVELRGRFDERLTIETDAVSVRAGAEGAIVDGGGEGRVVTIAAEEVTVDGLWIRHSGDDLAGKDAGVFVAEGADSSTLTNCRVDDIAFGVWVNGAEDVTIADNDIHGRDEVLPVVERGNGIQLWNADGARLEGNRIEEVRDGIYFSWADEVVATDNQLVNNRYGVHYMYSSDNRLEANISVDNDVGYALMVSNNLEIIANVAVNNSGASGHGILVKDIDDSVLRDNHVVENQHGLYVYNAQNNRIEHNLVLRNEIGIHYTAGSSGQQIVANSFIDNDHQASTTGRTQSVWTGDDRGNYWSDARTIDLNHDGTSELHHRPAGLVEHLVDRLPAAAAFAHSPAFDAIRLAESSFPIIEAPGILDERPLVNPPHDDWERYGTGR